MIKAPFFWIIISGLLLSLTLKAQNNPRHSGGILLDSQSCYDVFYYDLSLDVSPSEKEINGEILMFASLVEDSRTIAIHLDTVFFIDRVLAGSQIDALEETPYDNKDGLIIIPLPASIVEGSSFVTKVIWHGRPRSGPYGTFDNFIWDTSANGSPWIGVSCEAFGSDLWWPCKDHPSDRADSMDIHITIPSGLKAISNGKLIGIQESAGNLNAWHWHVSYPISNYCVSLNIADYISICGDYKSLDGKTHNICFYALPENQQKADSVFPEFLQHMRFMEDLAGPYPFWNDKYAIAEVPYMGMEHQTVIAYGAEYKDDAMARIDWDFDALHQHELSHEWFGNLLAPADWSDIWLNESFAQYTQLLYAEKYLDKEKYQELLKEYSKNLLNYWPIVPEKGVTFNKAYNADIYFKGALVLHTLRFLMGEDHFFALIRDWVYPDDKKHDECKSRFVTTKDFIQLAEKHYGKNLDWFFDVYLYSEAIPILSVKRMEDSWKFSWNVSDNSDFPMPVIIDRGMGSEIVNMSQSPLVLPFKAEKEQIDVDPDNHILMNKVIMGNK